MIPQNEYRVGNRFIRELHNSRGLEYDRDFVLTDEWMGKLFGDSLAIASDDLFPVPISVEVLTDFGFKNNGAMYSKPNNCVIDFDLTYVAIYSERHEDDIEFPLPKALHLLQNLYFFVTGTELKQPPTPPIQ